MKITAHDLKELDVVDDIIPEFGGADEDAPFINRKLHEGQHEEILGKRKQIDKGPALGGKI